MKIKIGDLVQYREWKEGDLDQSSVPEKSRSWGQTGLVIEICDWEENGSTYPGEGVIISTEKGFNECRRRDLGIIK